MGTDLKAKYLGAMVGSALGDAIGELAFHYSKKEHLCTVMDRIEKLIYTDDTAMAIGLAESILQKRGIDPQHLGDTFNRNFHHEPWRGYASGPPTIFSIVRRYGISYVEAAKSLFGGAGSMGNGAAMSLFGGAGSMGNGAAMRIAPVGLVFHNSEHFFEEACGSAEVTHAPILWGWMGQRCRRWQSHKE